MAAQDITYDDVAAAAARLREQGQAVTLDAVRAGTGADSVNAIYGHLAAWRAEHAEAAEPPRAALPESIVADIAAWARQFAVEAGAADRDALAEADAERAALAAAGDALESERDGLRAERDAAQALLAEREETIERLNAELRNARHVAMEALVSKAKDQLAIEGKDSQLAALRAEIERNVAAQAAESDRRLAAEMDLIGATTARAALEAEIGDLRGQMEALRARR